MGNGRFVCLVQLLCTNMITLEEALIIGTNAPKQQQRVIARLTTRLTNAFEAGAIVLEALPALLEAINLDLATLLF